VVKSQILTSYLIAFLVWVSRIKMDGSLSILRLRELKSITRGDRFPCRFPSRPLDWCRWCLSTHHASRSVALFAGFCVSLQKNEDMGSWRHGFPSSRLVWQGPEGRRNVEAYSTPAIISSFILGRWTICCERVGELTFGQLLRGLKIARIPTKVAMIFARLRNLLALFPRAQVTLHHWTDREY
jgi:hypothetical protein